MVIVDLHSSPRFGSQDELAPSPWVAGDQFCRSRVVLQCDSLEAVVDGDLHGQIVQLVVSVSHSEPGEERGYHVSAGGMRLDHDGLVCQVRPQTRGVHADGVTRHVGADTVIVTRVSVLCFTACFTAVNTTIG